MAKDTIAAIATPVGTGAIAILRLSGELSFPVVQKLIRIQAQDIIPWKMHHSWIHHPDSLHIVDEVLCCFMKAPKSYSGEDMVEIYCHGGYLAPNTILSLLIKLGCRIAEPGEFTRRAIENGKMDLIQAEFIQQMACAKTEKELELSAKNVSGHLSHYLNELKESINDYVVWAEAILSFPDQISEQKSLKDLLPEWKSKAKYLIEQYHLAKPLSDGFHIAIVGKTNVGKSSIFNALAEKNRSLISPWASTTHDYIHEFVLWEGYPISLYDTAGWVSNPNPVDLLCMEQTERIIQKSTLVLLVIDMEDKESMNMPYIESLIAQYPNKLWIIINKVDLTESNLLEDTLRLPLSIPVSYISAKTGRGMDDLKKELIQSLPLSSLNDLEYWVNERWHKSLLQILQLIDELEAWDDPDAYLDISAKEIKQIYLLLEEQLGYNHKEELYRQIFQKFCIGK